MSLIFPLQENNKRFENTQTLDACMQERIYQVIWVENQPHKSGLRRLRRTLQILKEV